MLRSKWTNPLDKKSLIKFVYCDSGFDLSTAIGGTYYKSNVFRGNSLYDPDETGVGVQPYGYDQLTAIFDYKYRVYASKIRVTFYLEEACYDALIGVYANKGEFSYHDPADLMVAKGVRSRHISSQEGITWKNTIKAYSTTKAQLPVIASDSDTTASVGANPAMTWKWIVFVNTANEAQEVSIKADVKITYYALMSRSEDFNES